MNAHYEVSYDSTHGSYGRCVVVTSSLRPLTLCTRLSACSSVSRCCDDGTHTSVSSEYGSRSPTSPCAYEMSELHDESCTGKQRDSICVYMTMTHACVSERNISCYAYACDECVHMCMLQSCLLSYLFPECVGYE